MSGNGPRRARRRPLWISIKGRKNAGSGGQRIQIGSK